MLSLKYLRQFRIFGYALFDILVSFVAIYFLSPLLSKLFLKIRVDIPPKNWLLLTLPMGILTHLILKISTPMTRDFFDPSGHYALKLLILTLLILGTRGIRVVG